MSAETEIYTDGACRGNPGPGGWGVLLRHNGHEKTLYGAEAETTNNRMELMAAIKGLESLTRPCRVRLTTDSQYVMKGIQEWMANWKKRGWKTAAKKPVKNQDLWIALDEAIGRVDPATGEPDGPGAIGWIYPQTEVRDAIRNDLPEAAVHFDRALARRPEWPLALYLRGRTHLDLGDHAAAMACFERGAGPVDPACVQVTPSNSQVSSGYCVPGLPHPPNRQFTWIFLLSPV